MDEFALHPSNPSSELGSVTDDHVRENQLRIHRDIEAERRRTYEKFMRELSSLMENSHENNPRFTQLNLLEATVDLLNQINLRYQNNPLLPSHLTEDEDHFFKFEASQSFLFITTIESSTLPIVHVSDSIHRVLHLTPQQWLGHDLLSLIHPNDRFDIQNQFIGLTNQTDKIISWKCRLNQGNNSFISVVIDGRIKTVDYSLQSTPTNIWGSFVFIGICTLPLTSEYNEKNMHLYKNPDLLIFSCRCLPNTWKVVLIDRSITTFPFISFDKFREKSILEFISPDDRSLVHQSLSTATNTLTTHTVLCYLMFSSSEKLLTILEIRSFLNSSQHKVDFLELIFTSITELSETIETMLQ